MKERIYTISIAAIVLIGFSMSVAAGEVSGTVSDPEYLKLYLNDVKTKLSRTVLLGRKKAPVGTEAKISFDVDQTGNTKNIKVIKSSGHNDFDEACLRTIRFHSPFRPVSKQISVQALFGKTALELTASPQ